MKTFKYNPAKNYLNPQKAKDDLLYFFICCAKNQLIPTPNFTYNDTFRLFCHTYMDHQAGLTGKDNWIFNMPPAMCKSLLTITAIAWQFGRRHDYKTIFVAHNHSLCKNQMVRLAGIMRHPIYKHLFGIPDNFLISDTASNIITYAQGSVLAITPESGVTGHRATNIHIDDPQDAQQGVTPVMSAKVVQFLNNACNVSRAENVHTFKGWMTMQRLNMIDATASMLRDPNTKQAWGYTRVPFIEDGIIDIFADKLEIVERKEYRTATTTGFRNKGDNIDAERFPFAKYSHLNQKTFMSQYQQNPINANALEATSEWLNEYTTLDGSKLKFNYKVFVDFAHSTKKTSDYTAIILLGYGSDKNKYLIEAWVERMDVNTKWQILSYIWTTYPNTIQTWMERSGSEIDWIKQRMQQEGLNTRFIKALPCDGSSPEEQKLRKAYKQSKEDRIRKWINEDLQSGKFYVNESKLIKFAKLNNELYNPVKMLKDSINIFPNLGCHDDMIDAISMSCFIPETSITYPDHPNLKQAESIYNQHFKLPNNKINVSNYF